MAMTTPTPSMLSIVLRVLVLWSLLSLLFNCCCHAQDLGERKVHIVFLDPSVRSSEALALKLLGKVLEGGKPADSLIYTFHVFNGFIARLTESEAGKLGRLKGVISVALDDGSYHLQPVGAFAPEGS